MLNLLIFVAAFGAPMDRAPVVAVAATPVRIVARIAEVRPARRLMAAVVDVQPVRRLVRARPVRSVFQNRQPVRRVGRFVFRR